MSTRRGFFKQLCAVTAVSAAAPHLLAESAEEKVAHGGIMEYIETHGMTHEYGELTFEKLQEAIKDIMLSEPAEGSFQIYTTEDGYEEFCKEMKKSWIEEISLKPHPYL